MSTYKATPNSITVPGGATFETPDPIDWVMKFADYGARVELEPGIYNAPPPILEVRPSYLGGPDGQDPEAVVIRHGNTDTLGFAKANAFDRKGIELANFTILCSWRSGLHFGASQQPHWFRDVVCRNLIIDGQNSPAKPFSSKWGVISHRLDGFLFSGCQIINVQHEHGMYLHNNGPSASRIEYCKFSDLGRTAVQVVGRVNENGGTPSLGQLTLYECSAHNTGIADGGASFTFSGQQGALILDRCSSDFDEQHPKPGRGALVIWPEYGGTSDKPGTPNGDVLLRSCHFRMPQGKGTSPLVRVSACERLVLDDLHLSTGLNPIAFDLNPPDGGMAGALFPVKEVLLAGDVFAETSSGAGKPKVAINGIVSPFPI